MVSIQLFSMDDYDEVTALWRVTPGIGLSDADSRERIADYLIKNPGLSFVARADGNLVGAVLCGTDGRRGYLHHMAVHPKFRHLGIASILEKSCLSGLKEMGILKCHLFGHAGNTGGRTFWERIGWKLRTDLVLMSKNID